MNDIVIRTRQPDDLDACVAALRLVHESDAYPLNWPADPHRWLTPKGLLRAWVAEEPRGVIGGHVALQHAAATHADPDSPAAEPPSGLLTCHATHQNTGDIHADTHTGEVTDQPMAELSRLYVAPAARRRSVATALLAKAVAWAAEHNCRLTLNVIDEQRSAAIAFYEASGWLHTRSARADWTTADGAPVTLRHYRLPHRLPHQDR